nr:hypothetical protein [Tanacetum cinerariifolium]
TNEVLNALEVTEKLELTETDGKCADGLVKDGAVDPTPEPIHVSQSQEAETIEAVKAAEEKVEESLTSEIITEEAKDLEEVCEKIESESVKESEVNNDKIELDHEVAPEVIKESEIEPTVEGIVDEIKIESDREIVPEEVSETDKKVSVSIEKEDLGEHIQEVVSKLDTQFPEVSETELYVLVQRSRRRRPLAVVMGSGQVSVDLKKSFFSDAVTEFSDSGTSQGGSVNKSLEDLFYSFSDGENEAKKSTSLKNLLGEAKSPTAKKTDHASVNDKEGIEDGKKGWKKVKRVRSWVLYVCCSAKSPSAKKTDHAAKAVNDKDGDRCHHQNLTSMVRKGGRK